MLIPIVFASALALLAPEEVPDAWRTVTLKSGSELRYLFLEPPEFDPDVEHRLILALPPGPQNDAMVERGAELYWREAGASRGFVIASPSSPDGKPFFATDSGVLIELLDHLEGELRLTGNPILVGPSNGGRSAFALALDHPDRFSSVAVLPGMPVQPESDERLARMKDLPLAMFVGGEDKEWRRAMEDVRVRLMRLGAERVSLRVFEGEGHVPQSLTGGMVFDALDALSTLDDSSREVRRVLDDFHDAASAADGARYFGHFAKDAIFLGTDATERWTVDEFKAYAEPFFSAGRGWTYVATERHVTVALGQATAWFDERLQNEKYGEVRGSGVLVLEAGEWKIAQYNLAFPVPNDRVDDLLKLK